MLVWLLGVLILATWLMMRFRQLRSCLCGKADETDLPDWLYKLLAETAKKLNLKHLPELILSQNVSCPAVFGVLRPVLLLPSENITKISRKDTGHILLHELAHIKRGDLWMHGIYMVLQLIYWFNPLLWLVRRKLQHLRELCCDATVAGILREKTADYRETILQTAKWLLDKPKVSGIGILGLVEGPNRLLVRLNWLEKKTWRYQKMKRVTIITVAILMIAFVLPMAKAQKSEKTDTRANIEQEQKSAKSLHQAAAAGDVEQVKTLISKGADVNAKDEKGWTPLHEAAEHGHKDVAELLIAKGADVNAQTTWFDFRPLHAAAMNLNFDVVKLLIDNGADVDTRPFWRAIPDLNMKDPAVYDRFLKTYWPKLRALAELLLAHGVDVNERYRDETLLYYASAMGLRDAVDLFITHGADVNAKTENDMTPLHAAVKASAPVSESDRTSIVKMLISKGADVNARDKEGGSVLWHAEHQGYRKIAELLREHGAKEQAPGASLDLHQAVAKGDVEQVKSLIAKGAGVNAKDKKGRIPLHAAARFGQKELVQLMLAKGAEVNTKDKGGWRPLDEAVNGGHKEVVELLIEAGSAVNVQGEAGYTPLQISCFRGQRELVELLIAKGADLEIKNQLGQTALHVAAYYGHKEIVELLRKYGAKE